jgi:hypothetical protein
MGDDQWAYGVDAGDDKDISTGTVLAWVVGILLAIVLFQAMTGWSLFDGASDTPTYQDPGVGPGQENCVPGPQGQEC